MRTQLTQRQETFCLKYCELESATEAAIQAGYSPKYAGENVPKILKNTNVQARIREIRQKIEDATVMNTRERRQILTEIARARMVDFAEVGQDGAWFNIDETNINNRAIQSIQSKTVLGKDGAGDAVFIRVNLHDPTKSIDLLNKMDKLYTDGYQDNRVVNRVVNVFVVDAETKNLIARVAERTKLLANGHENNKSLQSDS